jgi:hypothetical protein
MISVFGVDNHVDVGYEVTDSSRGETWRLRSCGIPGAANGRCPDTRNLGKSLQQDGLDRNAIALKKADACYKTRSPPRRLDVKDWMSKDTVFE